MIRRFLEEASVKLQVFMIGRYGGDELNHLILIATLPFVVLSIFWWYFYIPVVLLLGLAVFRALSKNISKRQKEREAFLKLIGKIRSKYRLTIRKWRERKTHCYFKCKQCKAVIRIPKGLGEVNVGCPHCGNRTKRKS